MRIKRLIIGLLVAALGFGFQSANALQASDARPMIPITDPTAENWFAMRSFIEMSKNTFVVLYKENDYYAKVSTDGGETWGETTDLGSFGFWTNGVNLIKIDATHLLLTYRDNGGGFLSRIGTLTGNTVSFSDPTSIYTPANNLTLFLSTYATVADGNNLYAYFPLVNYQNFTGQTELVEYKSTDLGATWTPNSTILTYSENRIVNGIQAVLLDDGRRVVHSTMSDLNNDLYTILKVSNGSNWDLISNDAELQWGNMAVVNDGKGLALMSTGGGGHSLNTRIWQDIDNQPIISNNQSEAWAGGQMMVTDGGSTVAIQYVDKMNQPNSYGGRSAEILITKDFGATWSSHVFETIPDDAPAADYRLYGSFLVMGEDGGFLYGYGTNAADQEGFTIKISTSLDGGTTWTDPTVLIDGYEYDTWGWTGPWYSGESPILVGTVARDITNNYYMGINAIKFNMPVLLPDKLIFRSKFEYGRLKLTTTEKAELREWAEQIADGTSVVVTAPDFIKPDVKRKAKRSLSRANFIAKILRNSGLEVSVVKGKMVKAISPAKGRTVKIEIPVK